MGEPWYYTSVTISVTTDGYSHFRSRAERLAHYGTQVDFNLYGMGYVRLNKALFRGELPLEAGLPPQGWLGRECAPDSDTLHLRAYSHSEWIEL